MVRVRPCGRLSKLWQALATVYNRENMCELEGLEYILNPCAWLDTWLHLGLDPEVGPRLEYYYSVIQLPPEDYSYDKWCDGGPVFQANPCED